MVHCRYAWSDLVRYLEGFAHTTAVMQTKDHLERVAFEAAIDLARDGVVYAEVRFAPELHLDAGLTLHEAVEAVLEGFDHGMRDAKNEGHPSCAGDPFGDAPSEPQRDDCRAWRSNFANGESAASTSRDPKMDFRRRITCGRSTSCSVRTST